MVHRAGLEPAASRVEAACASCCASGGRIWSARLESNQRLPASEASARNPSASRKHLVDAKGIEPPLSGCKPDVLPLSLRAQTLEHGAGIEPATTRFADVRLTDRLPVRKFGAGSETRTRMFGMAFRFLTLRPCPLKRGAPWQTRTALAGFVAQHPHPEEGAKNWSERRESNPCLQVGSLRHNRYATPARTFGTDGWSRTSRPRFWRPHQHHCLTGTRWGD